MDKAKVTIREFIKKLQEYEPTDGIKVIINGIIEDDVYLSIGEVADDNKNVYIGVHNYTVRGKDEAVELPITATPANIFKAMTKGLCNGN